MDGYVQYSMCDNLKKEDIEVERGFKSHRVRRVARELLIPTVLLDVQLQVLAFQF